MPPIDSPSHSSRNFAGVPTAARHIFGLSTARLLTETVNDSAPGPELVREQRWLAFFEGLAVSHYPTFEQLVSNPRDPETLLVLTPSYRSFLSLMIIWLFSVLVVLLVSIAVYRSPYSFINTLPVRWLALIPLALLLEIIRRKYNQAYIFGIDKATQKIGRLWIAYEETVIEYGDVRSINVVQSFWGRVFNFGTVEISTAAQEDSELQLEGMINPEQLAALVDRMRTYSRELDRAGSEGARTND